jgi:hypothetical protein
MTEQRDGGSVILQSAVGFFLLVVVTAAELAAVRGHGP